MSSGVGSCPGTSPAVPLLSSGGVSVSLPLADFYSCFPCAVVPAHARVVCCATTSFVSPVASCTSPPPFPFYPPCPPRSASLPVVSGSSGWHTAPGTGMSHRRKRICGTCIAWYCMSTLACIHSRRRRQDKPNALVPWCVLPAPSPSPSFPPPPWSFTKRHARFACPSLYLKPSISREDVADVRYEFRCVPRWPYVFPTRRFLAQFSKGCMSPPPLCLGLMRIGGGVPPTGIIDFIILDTIGNIFYVKFLVFSHWFISIRISQLKDHPTSVYQARYTTYVEAKYLDIAIVMTSTKVYKTTFPCDMIFTKDVVSTSDEKIEKLSREFNIHYRAYTVSLTYLFLQECI